MQRVWSWMAVNFGRHAGVVGVIGLAITLVLGVGATRLEFATGQDSYLNEGEQVYRDSVAYQDLFGGQAVVTLFTMDDGTSVVDLFTQANIDRMRGVEAELRATEGVYAVVGPLTALEFTQAMVLGDTDEVTEGPASVALIGAREREPDPAAQDRRLADATRTLERVNAVPPAERTFDNPAWIEFLLFDNQDEIRKSLRPFFPDPTHAQIVTRLDGNAPIEDEGTASEEAIAITTGEEWDNASVVTTGASVLLKELNDYLRGGLVSLGGIAIVIMAVLLGLLFAVRWRLVPLFVVLVGIAWAFGLAGYIGIPLSVVTIAGLPVMLGIGIDYAIQMHARIEEEVVLDRAAHPIQEASVNLGPALLVVTLDAVFAFTALRFAKVPMIRDFGLLLSIGIAVICITSIILPIAVLGTREYRSPTRGKDFRHGALGRIVGKLGSLPPRVAPLFALAGIAVFAGGVAVDGDLRIQSDVEEWVNQDSETIRDINILKTETGSSAEMGIFVETDDVFGDETASFVHGFATEHLATYPDDLLTASSLVTTVSFLLEIPDTTPLPPTGDDVRRAYEVAPPDIQRSLLNPDAGALNLVFRTGPGSLEHRAVYTNEIRDHLEVGTTAGGLDIPDGTRATPSGLAVVGVGLLENIQQNRSLLTYLAIVFVFVFLILRLRSVVRGLLSIVPILVAVGTTTLVAWTAGFELSPMTAVSGPLVVAVCTEFTSLLLLRFIEERRRGLGPAQAVAAMSARTGRAFMVSAATGVAGVLVIASSSQPVLRDFGLIVAMNVSIALLSALVIMPPLLIWAEQRGWVSRGMLREARRAPIRTAPAEATTG
jgi:uncharacterized protein